MSKYYSVIDLSENISKTPEGYLVCKGAAIARAGDLMYQSYETGIDSDTGVTVMTRTIEDLCSPETIASFEGKPITIGHPDGGGQFVNPDNWQDFAVGSVQNVRQGEELDSDKLIADLIITDREAIQTVEDEKLRELSCGYDADFKKLGDGKGQQTNIIGNHVALVRNGRCGSQCAIFDSAPVDEKQHLENKQMTKGEKIKKLLGMVVDENLCDEKPEQTVESRLKAMETSMAGMATGMAKMNKFVDECMESKDEDPAPEAKKDAPVEDQEAGGDLSEIKSILLKVLGAVMPTSDEDKGDDKDEKKTQASDNETLSRAEILAPGLEDSADIKKKALDSAYKTVEGKSIIDKLLCGKAFDSADHDMLFVSASEMLSATRVQKVNGIQKSKASDSKVKTAMTAEELQEQNDQYYAKK